MNGQWKLLAMLLMMVSGLAFSTTSIQAQAPNCATTHVVQRGETLYRIALHYRTTVSDLQTRNHIANPNRIYAGQRLCISGQTNQPPPPSVGSGTVTAYFLNVRSGPGTQYGVIRIARRGQVFSVNGRNANSTWLQITVDSFGTRGWVNARYLNTPNVSALPVVEAPPASYSGYFVLANNASVSIAPGAFQTVDPHQIWAGMTVRVIGRNASATWFQIATDNGTGWLHRDSFPAEFPQYLFPVTA